jgi:23S rRNA pseudouridine2605 synthase
MAQERLQKILARGGIASRRAAEALITEGRVRINGRIVRELGTKADPWKDRIDVDGKRVVAEQLTYVAVHKPRGMVSTMSDPEGRPSMADLLKTLGARVYPVGRLDFATSGILLATNDGDFANGLLHPKKNVPKTYVMKLAGEMKEEDLDHWRNGIELEDGKTLPAKVSLIRYEGGKTWIEVTIHEGRNQQIRRMGEASGFPVMRLARTVFAGISSEGLAPGRLRPLTREELTLLKKEYGVPKRIPATAAVAAAAAPSAHGRRAPRTTRTPEERGRRSQSSSQSSGEETPRYGGGSPGRRGYDVREDWGGGSGRGSSGRRDESSSDRGPPGRGGRSRTTGTGGGIGAGDGSFKMPRGRRR